MLHLSPGQLLPPALAFVTLTVTLIFGERTGNLRIKGIFKPITSAMFLLTALMQDPQHLYDWLIVAGLGLCAIGDVALIRRERSWFLAGLVAFLLGHVAYAVAFNTRASLLTLHPVPMAAIIAVSIGLFLYFRPHLGKMLWPAAAYIVVITLMLISAMAVAAGEGGSVGPGLLVPLGATLFYVSDITVARDRFMPGVGFANRAYGLPLYYAAQFLFALSIGH
jgi:uncharacterized membrane protein YhhN